MPPDATNQPPASRAELLATAGTTLTSFFLQGVLVVSGVLAARLLGVSDRGELAFFWIIALIVAQLGTLGVPAAVTYFIAGGHSDVRHMLRVTRRLLLLQCVGLTCIQAAVLWAFLHGMRGAVRDAAGLTALSMPGLMLHQYGLAILQGKRRFRLYNLQRSMPPVLYGLGLVVVSVLGRGSLVIVTSVWVASILVGGIATFAIAHVTDQIPIEPIKAQVTLRDTLRFGSRALLGVFTGFEQLQLDQAIVGLVLSTHALGLYVVAIAFSNLPRFIGQSIGLVAFPAVARIRGAQHIRNALWRYFILGAVACLVVVLCLLAIVPTALPTFFGQSYRSAVPVAEILLFGALFQSVRRILSDAARGAGYPLLGTVAELTSWIVLVPAIALIAPNRGLQGMAIAFSLASAASFFIAGAGLLILVRSEKPPLPDRFAPGDPASVRPADPLVP